MNKKCLIVFSSFSGNTAKVADRFKSTFEKNGWECDMFRIGRKFDYMNPPFEFKNYDFVCIGDFFCNRTRDNDDAVSIGDNHITWLD